MSWSERLRAWWSGGPSADSLLREQEVDEELMFHLRSLVEDNLARGMPANAAWQEAQRRFGSLRRYAEACRRGAAGGQLLRLVPTAALFLAGVWVGWQLLGSAGLPRPWRSVALGDLTGRVVDARGEPLADATLLVILKTWPGDCYRQQPFATESDAAGNFCLPRLIPGEGQFAVQVAAFRSGYALASSYQLHEGPGPHTIEPVTLALAEASPITLVVQDCNGRSVARARVVPASRQSPDGQQHLVYFQGSEPIQAAADSAGQVVLNCFAPGDQAKIFVQLPGQDWETHAIRISPGEETITVSAQAADDGEQRPDVAAQAPS